MSIFTKARVINYKFGDFGALPFPYFHERILIIFSLSARKQQKDACASREVFIFPSKFKTNIAHK